MNTIPQQPAAASQACRVVICRGCCCGTTTRHPDTDHQAQTARLAALPAGQATVTTSSCLGRCDDGNNIVVIPSRAGRQAGGTVTWLGAMLTPELTEAVAAWVSAGGPGLAAMPPELAAYQLTQPLAPAGSAVSSG